MNRREMIRTVALAGAAIANPLRGQIRDKLSQQETILEYLESLAREDGGYGWDGQERSHLTATFYVIGCYRLFGQTPPDKDALAIFIGTHHPGALKKLEQERRIFEWQQVQGLVWLGGDASSLKDGILRWNKPLAYLRQYERHGYPLFSSEMGVILSRALLGLRELPREFLDYLDSRRRANGSFDNTPAEDGSEGHVVNTWWGLRALDVLGRTAEKKAETIAWLRSCQLSHGGFTFAPKPEFGGVDDVAYTWAAVRALKLLGAAPARPDACLGYLHSLANGDGGFADRRGWLSNPMATFYALDALKALDGLDALGQKPALRAAVRRQPAIPSHLKVFSIQLEAHGQGSPTEAVDLARALRIHLWGAKNARPGWLARAQLIADQQKAPVTFFVSNEEYGTWVNIPGQGTYSHTSDIIAPANAPIGPSLANAGEVSWEEFRRQRLAPLEKAKGRLIWQFGENEELVRMFLDDSVERGGYAAISTYHFGNPDFTNSEPFLHRWRGKIPFVALQDAHGAEPWWFADMTTGFRTLFLAAEPTWEGWLAALKRNWVVPVRHDQWTQSKTWMHAASRDVLAFVREREPEWRWWDNERIQRPLVSIVAVRPEDEFEAARPDRGLTLRVRCAWENTPQRLLKKPIAQFVRMTIDDAEVSPTLVSKKRPNGLLEDHYHHLDCSMLRAGEHTAHVVARLIATGAEISRTLRFRASL